MRTWVRRGGLAGVLLAGLSACSTIKSWFPDKERDYQFTYEIPELTVPDDLKNRGLKSPTPSARVAPAEVAEPVRQAESAEQPEKSAQAAAAPAEKPVTASASGAGSSLQIDQPHAQAVRMVARALSRQKLEIVERNVEKGYFYIKFDPNAVKAQDASIWDEFTFLFGDDPSQEQEFRINTQEVGPQLTEVTVQDSAGHSLSDATANSLLQLITDAINDTVKEDASQNPQTPAAPEN